MLLALILISCLFFVLIAPAIAVKKYYSVKNYSLLANIGWIVIAVITWPLLPIILAIKHHDKLILSMLWVSFLVGSVALGYWVATHSSEILEFQRAYLAGH